MKRPIILAFLALVVMASQGRERRCFDHDWRFLLADSVQMAQPGYDDSWWRQLDLPHDWAIEGDFHAGNPSGAGGGALPGGVGWYRKTFTCPDLGSNRLFLEFDGVYMNSSVYVNGQKVGERPYGYSSFEYDITPYIRKGRNVVAVRVDNSDQPNSRWYSGCGIYRHVWLTVTHPVHVRHWGVYVNNGKVEVDYENPTSEKVTVRNIWLDAEGRKTSIRKLRKWSCDDPYTYRVRTQLLVRGKVVDEVETVTGFRDFRFDAKTGFWLNGKNLKLNGVCEHHDFGCLGAALHEDALHRKLTKLKAMGVNSIRSSHNPPAPELLNMCDTMGLIVMDESFDMWRRRKTQNDYARFFDEWHERDLTDWVKRDRNHPSVLMWSIGNEVLEQWSSAEADTLTLEQANLILNAGRDASALAREGEMSVNTLLADHLADIVRKYDVSRPITAGCNEPSPQNHLFKGNAIDIIGFNYHHQNIADVPVNFPGRPFIMTESVSALQTRGFYKMPSDSVYTAPKAWWLPYTDPTFMCSAYDNMHASWSSTHEETWDVVKHTPFVGGQYIWTGFDYIGEPTPYGFPARSSYFGIIDLAGFPKDIYYMYQSEWTAKPVLHLFPHWNWLPGQAVDMWCYYNNADEVELFVNGKSQGIRRKGAHDYHVMWRVAFEPGEVSVVARKGGKEVASERIQTAGAPHHIRLTVDYDGAKSNTRWTLPAEGGGNLTFIPAEGGGSGLNQHLTFVADEGGGNGQNQHLTFVAAEVVDKDGRLCPLAGDQLLFSVDGNARIIGTDNGCQTSMERFTSPQRKAFFGRCMVVVRGKGTLKAQSPMLQEAEIRL